MSAILVAGGTGQCGSACVHTLSAAGATVRVLTRDKASEKAAALAGLNGVTLVKGDYLDSASLPAAFQDVQAVFLACNNFEGQVEAETNVIDAAVAAAGCKYLVKLGTCGAAGYTDARSIIEYARYHAAIEAHLATTSLHWTVLRPNSFMQNHMGDIFGTLPQNVICYPMPGTTEASLIDARDIGDVAAALLQAPDKAKHAGQAYDVCGPESLSTQSLAAMYAEELGRPIIAVEVPREEYAESAEKAGFPAWLANAVSLSLNEFWGRGKFSYGSSSAVMELCKPQRTMRNWIKEHAPLSPNLESKM